MNTLQRYLREHTKEINLKIKFPFQLSEDELKLLRRVLDRWNLLAFSETPRKTIVQKYPLDFKDVTNAEIFIYDCTLSCPVTEELVRQEICSALDLPAKYVVVRNLFNPTEIDELMQRANEIMHMNALENGEEFQASLETPYKDEYPDDFSGSKYFGNKYNELLKSYLRYTREKRKENFYGKIPQDPSVGDPERYNASISDAPRVYVEYDEEECKKMSRRKDFVNFYDDFDATISNIVKTKNGPVKKSIKLDRDV